MQLTFYHKGKEISSDTLSKLCLQNGCVNCKKAYEKCQWYPYEERKFLCGLCSTNNLCTNCVYSCDKCIKNICVKCGLCKKCKGCKSTFCEKHFTSRCESCQSKEYCHDCLYKNKFQCTECFSKTFQEKDKIIWNHIDCNNPNLPNKPVLCTNNIKSTRNDGTMSHVWVSKLKKVKLGKDYSDYYRIDGENCNDYHGIGAIMHIDYWADLKDNVKLDHTNRQIENLRLLGSKELGYYSVIVNTR